MKLIKGVEHFAESELHQNYRLWLKKFKHMLKLENNLAGRNGKDIKRQNFDRFKHHCRDRKHNAIAGYVRTKDNLYFWFQDMGVKYAK